jgi:hypothetical protein
MIFTQKIFVFFFYFLYVNCNVKFHITYVQLNKFWGYVAICVQLYCRWFAFLRLVVAVLHYMFRPTWPSSGAYDVLLLYSWRNLLRCFCCLFLHMVTLCTFSSVGWVKYDVLLFIIPMLLYYSVIVYMFLLSEADSFRNIKKWNIIHTWRWPCRPKHVV